MFINKWGDAVEDKPLEQLICMAQYGDWPVALWTGCIFTRLKQGNKFGFPPELWNVVGAQTFIEHFEKPVEGTWSKLFDLLAEDVIKSSSFVVFHCFDGSKQVVRGERSSEALDILRAWSVWDLKESGSSWVKVRVSPAIH